MSVQSLSGKTSRCQNLRLSISHGSFQSCFRGQNLSVQLQDLHVPWVEYKAVRFWIPEDRNSWNRENFVMVFNYHNVRKLVRVCKVTYDKELLESVGIEVVDLEYDDGAPPPDQVIDKWFQLITDVCHQGPGSCIAVHCKAGLGRAPALVAAALIELGLPYDEAVEMIRGQRNGALNARQVQYLKNFHPKKRLRNIKSQSDRCRIL
uniref:protein-tyrosine-phosphatase n=1 Tax=Schistosoma japonicum TaxID=6182 RepID=Q5DEV7_SCHJA|nr:SJCHGC02067 protein [Schistosoma japonicum]